MTKTNQRSSSTVNNLGKKNIYQDEIASKLTTWVTMIVRVEQSVHPVVRTHCHHHFPPWRTKTDSHLLEWRGWSETTEQHCQLTVGRPIPVFTVVCRARGTGVGRFLWSHLISLKCTRTPHCSRICIFPRRGCDSTRGGTFFNPFPWFLVLTEKNKIENFQR